MNKEMLLRLFCDIYPLMAFFCYNYKVMVKYNRKVWDIIDKHKILSIVKEISPKKYLVKCLNCWTIEEKWYNSFWNCRSCKTFNRKTNKYEDYIELELTWWEYTKIDYDIYEQIKNYCWYKSIRKSVESRIRHKLIKLHHIVMWKPKKWMVIDHINWDTLDNRRSNLRLCTLAQNAQNQHKVKWKTSKYKWIHWSKYKQRFEARFFANKKLYCKVFKDEFEAVLWYDETIVKIQWEYAYTNKMLWLY